MADCVNSSPPLICRNFRDAVEFGQSRGNLRDFAKTRGTQWNSGGFCCYFCMALNKNSVGIPGRFRGKLGFRVAIPIALFRPEIGNPARNGPTKQKEEKWPFFAHFPIFRPFFSLFSRYGQNPYFSAIFFPFRAGSPISGLYRAIGIASLGWFREILGPQKALHNSHPRRNVDYVA